MAFNLYGKYAHLARRIIQHNDTHLVGKLFNYFDVRFENNFDRAVHMARMLSAHKNVVMATQFDLVDDNTQEKTPHTVSIWFNRKGNGYVYDAMGEISGQERVYMDVYKDYQIVREILGIGMTRSKSLHQIDTSSRSLFQQLYMLETNWRFLHMQDISIEDVAMHYSTNNMLQDVTQYSKYVIERAFYDV